MTATDPQQAAPFRQAAPSFLPSRWAGGAGGGPLGVTGLRRASPAASAGAQAAPHPTSPASGGGGQMMDSVMPESITEYASYACRT